jgi:hypothetical protein
MMISSETLNTESQLLPLHQWRRTAGKNLTAAINCRGNDNFGSCTLSVRVSRDRAADTASRAVLLLLLQLIAALELGTCEAVRA